MKVLSCDTFLKHDRARRSSVTMTNMRCYLFGLQCIVARLSLTAHMKSKIQKVKRVLHLTFVAGDLGATSPSRAWSQRLVMTGGSSTISRWAFAQAGATTYFAVANQFVPVPTVKLDILRCSVYSMQHLHAEARVGVSGNRIESRTKMHRLEADSMQARSANQSLMPTDMPSHVPFCFSHVSFPCLGCVTNNSPAPSRKKPHVSSISLVTIF